MKNIFAKTAKNSLLQNRARTITTLICIVVSVAISSIIVFSAASIHSMLVEKIGNRTGEWSIVFSNPSADFIKALEKHREVKIGKGRSIGYFPLEGRRNPGKPYGYITLMDDELRKQSHIELIEGRMPDGYGEVVIPDHLVDCDKEKYKIGNKLLVTMGVRMDPASNNEIGQHQHYEKDREIFVSSKLETLKIVGIIKRPAVEPIGAAGFTVIADKMSPVANQNLVYVNKEGFEATYEYSLPYFGEKFKAYYINLDLLKVLGKIPGSQYRAMLFLVTGILEILVALGTIFLIYNGFAITYRERRKQYNVLASIGATKKKMIKMFLWDGFFYGGVGIPIGIITGIVSTKIFFILFKDSIKNILGGGYTAMGAIISGESILIVIFLALITFSIAIIEPAWQVGNTDLLYNNKNVGGRPARATLLSCEDTFKGRFLWFLKEKFGPEAILGYKNYKRDTKRYFITIGSLIMSIILFVGLASVTDYVTTMWKAEEDSGQLYDISYDSIVKTEADAAFELLKDADRVKKVILSFEGIVKTEQEGDIKNYNLVIMDDESLKDILESKNLDKDKYFSYLHPTVVSTAKIFNYQKELLPGAKKDSNNKEKYRIINADFKSGKRELKIEGELNYINTRGLGEQDTPRVIMSDWVARHILTNEDTENFEGKALFKTDGSHAVYENFKRICDENNLSTKRLKNERADREKDRRDMLVVRLFGYSFMIFIFIMSIANVFNTITSNMVRRYGEFMILDNMGMTERAMKKALYWEGLFYTVKALIYGVPVAGLLSYLVYFTVNRYSEVSFKMPWSSFVFIICFVCLVIQCIIAYNIRKWQQFISKKKGLVFLEENSF